MKIAILANRHNSYVKPQAEGLQRMLSRLGVASHVFYRGLRAVRCSQRRSLARRAGEEALFSGLAVRLRRYDAVVVVMSVPFAFARDQLRERQLRWLLPRMPIVLYSNVFLATRGRYARWLLEGDASRGLVRGASRGLERYDWYLAASVVSEFPPPLALSEMCSAIGLDLEDGSLSPAPKDEFLALIDFERPSEMKERAIQIAALEETKTPYVVLNGAYSIAEIRKVYRRCSLYFLAFRESFGLPICELQACGAYIFTPYAEWCPSHWMKPDLSVPGPGRLSPNFVVYDGNKDRLVDAICRVRASYDAQRVFETFLAHHPHFFRGDLDELRKFVEMVRSGQIHGKLHERHPDLETLVRLIGL
jgi:hypothetical protein